jgi:hypothetical protein
METAGITITLRDEDNGGGEGILRRVLPMDCVKVHGPRIASDGNARGREYRRGFPASLSLLRRMMGAFEEDAHHEIGLVVLAAGTY